MTDDRSSRLNQRLAEDIEQHGEPAPPWVRFPTYGRYCLGWRMGSGEDWLELWWHWVGQTLSDPSDRMAYLRRHGPAPVSWDTVVWSVWQGEDTDGDLHPTQIEELRSLGLVQRDAAYMNWRVQSEQERGVWEFFGTPAKAARYDERTLTFWCRLFREDPSRVPADHHTPEWAAFFDCARSGTLPAEVPTDRGWTFLALTLAATATALPPWVLGLSVEAFTDSLEPDVGYADTWGHWVFGLYEDRLDWEAYLAQWETAPEDWRQLIQQEIVFL